MSPLARALLRTVPWAPVVGMTAGVAVLFGCAILLRHSAISGLLVVVALGAGAGCAAFLLDEPAVEIADATPASRGRRAGWRVALAPLVVGVLVVGLLALGGLDPATHWSRLWVVGLAGTLLGLGAAAGLKRGGRAAPGDLAAVLACGAVVLIALANPLQRWVPGLPLGAGESAARSVVMWVALGVVGALATVALERDPGR
ncbi:hypothetical protein [Flexivirga oryzae]|uniref:Uncharacterized protein n=1 Tax=Flexivirga oryzae TaxID=1794944 RepID=A0A839N650_9MICO|nr:hypothetical protein [Flexivirga oryzae]MBB2890675.1 hypothetical protein [Flexivirga oryzae]